MVLESAGLQKEDFGRAVKKAFDENERLITATQVHQKVINGQLEEFEVPDNGTRLRAIEAIYDFTGVKPSTRQENTGGGPTIVLNLPDYYSKQYTGETIEIEPSQSDDYGSDD